MVSLYHIASYFPGPACSAYLGGPTLEEHGIAIGIPRGGTIQAFFRRWRRRGRLGVDKAISGIDRYGFIRHKGQVEEARVILRCWW
jgi:hypothetical protein